MEEKKKKSGYDRSLLRIIVGGYLIYLAIRLFKGAVTVTESKTVFILFSVLFFASGLACIVWSAYTIIYKFLKQRSV